MVGYLTLTNRMDQFPSVIFQFHPSNNKKICTAASPDILGIINLTVNDNIQGLISFEYGLQCTVHLEHYFIEPAKKGIFNKTLVPKQCNIRRENKLLFREIKELPKELIIPKTMLEQSIELTFPSNKYLPSSCVELGSKSNGKATITILYNLVVCFTYFHLNEKRSRYYYCPIDYQNCSNMPTDNENTSSTYSQSNVFPYEFKNFTVDNNLNALLPIKKTRTGSSSNFNLSSGSHKFSNKFSKLKNKYGDYENGIAKSKFILQSNLKISNVLILNLPLNVTLPTLKLIYQGSIDSTFVYNGISTDLGGFEIRSIDIIIVHTLGFKIKNCKSTFTVANSLMRIKYKTGEKRIDFKDAEFDNENKHWFIEIDLSKPENKRLTDYLPAPIMCDCELEDYFKVCTTMEFIVKIEDGANNDFGAKEYKFQTNTTPDLEKNVYNTVEVEHEVAPPKYTDIVDVM